jgi:hypothetical protein
MFLGRNASLFQVSNVQFRGHSRLQMTAKTKYFWISSCYFFYLFKRLPINRLMLVNLSWLRQDSIKTLKSSWHYYTIKLFKRRLMYYPTTQIYTFSSRPRLTFVKNLDLNSSYCLFLTT